MLRQLSLVPAAAWLLLAACHAYDPAGGRFTHALTPGAVLQVMTEMRVPPGLARVYLQHGQAVGYAALDQYAPFCYFLMREPLPAGQAIRPGPLRVESVAMQETDVSRPVVRRLAALAPLANGDGRGVIALQSYMRVAAAGQPDVYALVCSGAFAAPMEARLARRDELREVFGSLVEIREDPAARSD